MLERRPGKPYDTRFGESGAHSPVLLGIAALFGLLIVSGLMYATGGGSGSNTASTTENPPATTGSASPSQ
jgi:hypothetical protein